MTYKGAVDSELIATIELKNGSPKPNKKRVEDLVLTYNCKKITVRELVEHVEKMAQDFDKVIREKEELKKQVEDNKRALLKVLDILKKM